MQVKERLKTVVTRAFVVMLAITLVFTMMPLNRGSQAHATDELAVKSPALVVTGTGLIGNAGVYDADNVSMEKSYTMDELKNFSEAQGKVTSQKYSAMKSQSPYARNYYLVDGVKVASLLGKNESEISDDVRVIATDGYAAKFLQEQAYVNGKATTVGLNKARYFYDFSSGEKGEQVPAVIGWADVNTGLTDGTAPTALPEGNTTELGFLRLYCGQYDGEGGGAGDMNQPLWNGKSSAVQVNKIQEGDAITEVVLRVGSKEYTRADILLMDFAERTYTYTSKGVEKQDNVRGVPLKVLLAGEDENSKVSFTAADGYDMSSSTKTVKELTDGNYMLGYEANGSGIYKTANTDASKYGFLTLYGDGAKPASMINSVSVETESGIDFSTSPYKHVTNGGITGQTGPYNIDSITGATLTIEGPGMTASTPLSVKDLESKDAGCARGVYSDTRDGVKTTRTYEGVDLYYILTGLEKSGIKMTDKAKKVTIKNRNRKAIATLSLSDIKAMHDAGTPALVAYGTAAEDGSNVRPFVFNDATGEDKDLGNGDGCLKFVYDLDTYGDQDGKYSKFGNMAYIYVEEDSAPGYKHDKAPYNKAENSQYVLTVTGDELGCEVNYTVEELENMVEYDQAGEVVDNGYGYRDEYSLANSSYWYVNSYEGVKLWSLLQHSGVDKSKANDENTKVTFRSTDNYTGFDSFTLAEVADPDKFGFYEKNAADNGDSYTPNENLREGDDVTTGDKLAVGYPVLVSYGANAYPYVISKNLDGYLSGLSNDGGPLRVISGKRNYRHANGSNQAKLLDKIVVGDNNYNYSTHTYQPKGSAYKALEESGLKVTINYGSKETVKDYTVKDLEELIYGGKLTKTQLEEAKVKGFYEVAKNGNFYSDLYEGVNLNYFLTDVVELAGEQGSITFKAAGAEPVTMSLEEVLAVKDGYNAQTELGGLTPVIAYAKNGYPLVADKTSEGYVKNQTLKGVAEGEADTEHTVQNNNGPLQLIFPRANSEAASTMGSLANITEIEINLEADAYAHIGEPYSTYAENTLTVQGEGTRLTEPKSFTVAELEGKQSLAVTKDYSFRNKSGVVSQTRYRGINLYNFLKSTNVGLKSNADKVLIYAEGKDTPYEFTLSDIRMSTYQNTETGAADLPVLLAYGSASAENENIKDGKPLVSNDTAEGYVAEYGNDGGPLKLIIGQTGAEDVNKSKCVKNVVKIEVTASEQVSWNHSSSEVFKTYLNDEIAFKVVDSKENELASKTYKISELEAMTDIISQEEIYAVQSNTWEGLNFWQLIQKTFGDIQGIDNPITITVGSKDGFSVEAVEKVGLDGLINGVRDGDNYVPVLLAYAVDGYPLASGGKGAGAVMGDGYDSSIDNKGGPMRLMVQNAQGACIMEVTSVTIKVGNAETPQEAADFTVASNTLDKAKTYSVAALKELGQEEKEYTIKGVNEKVRGVSLEALLSSINITDKEATFRIDAGGYGGDGTYSDISLEDAVAQDYFVAYEEYVDGEWRAIDDTSKTPNSKVRIYRNYLAAHPDADQTKWYDKCQYISGITVSVPERTIFKVFEGTSQEGELPLSGIRCVSSDKNGNMWIGTYGGGLSYKAKGSNEFVTYNTATEPALKSAVVSAVCADSKGGVWFTQNGSYSNANENFGVGYMKDGEITYYRASDNPSTIPNDYVQEIKEDKNGNIWFGSFGGLTKYDPAAGTWQTWNKADGFPAESVDNIEFDANGGIWCGFYPDTEDAGGSKPFTGGFAYFKDGKVVKSYSYTSEQDSNTSNYRLGDVWIRDIAVDSKGSAWIVASGSYGGMKNTGGVVWHVNEAGGEAVRYTGFELFGEEAFSTDSELRMVTVDPDGGLWFGTSKDGIFRVDDPTIIEGKLTLTDNYSSAAGSWPSGYDNVYSLDFMGDTLYSGSSKGLAVHSFEFTSAGEQEPSVEPAGDATSETADLIITGDALARDGYFTIKGIKNWDGITRVNATFHTRNSSGTEADVTVQGATLENIINVIGLAKGAEIESVTILSTDGRKTDYTADEALMNDIQGNKAMFIWTEGEEKVAKVCRGQMSENEVNKSAWAKDVNKIIFNKKADVNAVKEVVEAIEALPDAAQITIEDADAIIAARKAYDALSDAEKESVTNLESLKLAEKALDVIVRDEYVKKTEAAIDEISFSDYNVGNAIDLWISVNRLESKLKGVETAAEAAAVYNELNELLADIPTAAQEMEEALNDYPIEVTVKAAAPAINLKWNRIPKAESYDVLKSETAYGVFKKVKTVTEPAFTDRNVKVERAYFYKIVPCSKVNSEFVYGNESVTYAGKLKLAKPSVSLKAGKKKATIRWKKVYGADGYVIYRSKKKSSGFKTVKTIRNGKTVSYTNKHLKAKRKYYYKVKAYVNISGKRVYSSYSTVRSVRTYR